MLLLPQLSIKQELKLSEAPGQMKKKAVKDLMVSPKKKKRKQRSPAKVQVSFYLKKIYFLNGLTCMFVIFVHSVDCVSNTDMSLSLCCCRFSASMMMDHWASKAPSVTSVFTVMLHSEPTTTYRGMSSFTQVLIPQSCFKMQPYQPLALKFDIMLKINHEIKTETQYHLFINK